MRKLSISVSVAGALASDDDRPREDRTPCEHCLCAACERLCMKCTISCSPMDGRHIPLIGCPDFVDMRTAPPLRYTYRGGADVEYRLHLKPI